MCPHASLQIVNDATYSTFIICKHPFDHDTPVEGLQLQFDLSAIDPVWGSLAGEHCLEATTSIMAPSGSMA